VECVMRKSAVHLACLVVSWLLNLLDDAGGLHLSFVYRSHSLRQLSATVVGTSSHLSVLPCLCVPG